jgi:hypothetical protein
MNDVCEISIENLHESKIDHNEIILIINKLEELRFIEKLPYKNKFDRIKIMGFCSLNELDGCPHGHVFQSEKYWEFLYKNYLKNDFLHDKNLEEFKNICGYHRIKTSYDNELLLKNLYDTIKDSCFSFRANLY